jgi:uncharacterized protein YegL
MNEYQNVASGISPGTIVFLIDASKTMNRPMPGSHKTQIEMANDLLREIIQAIVQVSLKGGKASDRYHLGIIAYSDKPYVCTNGIVSIREVTKLPSVTTIERTNTKEAFILARDLIINEINQWDDVKRKYSPPPMIIHLTDGIYTEGYGDPKPIVEEIKSIQVMDGNVLVENVLISPYLSVKADDYGSWMGYLPDDDLGDPYGNELLSMSSEIPENYRKALREKTDGKVSLVKGSKMMFPGSSEKFVKQAFVMALATDEVLARINSENRPDSIGDDPYSEKPLP